MLKDFLILLLAGMVAAGVAYVWDITGARLLAPTGVIPGGAVVS